MADNIELSAGSGGAVIKTDDDGTAHWQYVKVAYGADNTQTLVTSTNGMPVILLAGTAEFGKLAAGVAEIGNVKNSGTFAVQSTLQAGTATFGKLAANSGVDIGDVDVTSVPAPLSTTGGGLEATALRVTIASDSTGVVSIDDNGGAITVDGTVTANLSATDNAVLDSIDGKITACNTGAVVLAAGVAEIGKLAAGIAEIGNVKNSGTFATQATLQTGSNAIGKLAANSGVDIGDVDVTSISAGANLIGDVGISGARTSGGTTIFRSIDLDETEEEVKATAGQVYWIHAINLKATPLYLKFYNATAANVTVGTTTPVLTFPVPSQGSTNGAGFNLAVPNGITFGTAITVAATTGVADNDTGAPGTNECIVNLGYA